MALPWARFQFSTLLSNGTRLFEPVYHTGISIFILLPLGVCLPVSFARQTYLSSARGYSGGVARLSSAVQNGLARQLRRIRIGVATCLLSLVLATFAVLGFGRQKFILQGVLEALVQAPLSVPAVVFALGAILLVARVGLVDTEIGIIIAHTVLIFPVVYLIASATYSSIDPRLSLAAASLGANPWSVFRTIVFPLLLPGLAIGALIAVLLSFDESVASIFLSDLSVKTLPRKLWEGIRFNTSPESAAVSAVLLGVTCAFIVVGIVVMLWRKRIAGAPTMIGVLDTSAEET
nr:ChtK [Agrobacterium sp.]